MKNKEKNEIKEKEANLEKDIYKNRKKKLLQKSLGSLTTIKLKSLMFLKDLNILCHLTFKILNT